MFTTTTKTTGGLKIFSRETITAESKLGNMPGWSRQSKSGRIKEPYNERKKQSDRLSTIYERSIKFIHHKYSKRLQECSRRLVFESGRTKDGEEAVKFKHAMHCNVRLCMVCQHHKSKKRQRTFIDLLPLVELENKGYVWLFLTIALKNVAPNKVKEEFKQLNEGLKRATKRVDWPAEGWIVSREITRGKDGSAHPHLHVMLLVPPSYFSTMSYKSHKKWLEFIRETFRTDYDPAVRIQRIGGKYDGSEDYMARMRKAVLEVFKYTVKAQDLLEESSWTLEITDQLHHLRAITTGGLLRKYYKQLEQDTTEDIEVEKWFIPDEEQGLIYLEWSFEKKEYFVSHVTKPELNKYLKWGRFYPRE